MVVPAGHVFLQGDNVANSSDSRHYGPVPTALVLGRVVAKVWPLRDWGAVESTMRWSGQQRWIDAEEEGAGVRARPRRTGSEGRLPDDAEGELGSRLPGRGSVHVLAESSAVQGAQQRDVSSDAPTRPRAGPQITIIPFTPAPKREPRAEG